MTRRFPPALGIIAVITAVHSLMTVSPMIAMMVGDGFSSMGWIITLLVAASVAQLVAGIAIATSSTHARIAVLAWTLVSLASATFARDLMAQDTSAKGLVVMYIEALAGPVLAWLALVFAGEAVPSPVIPHARVVSAGVAGAPSSTSEVTSLEPDAPPEIAARRPRVGVLLLGFAITGLLGTLLWHIPLMSIIVRGDNLVSALAGEVVFLAHAIATGILAIRAGRRLLDPRVDARRARSAVLLYILVDVGGDLLRVGLQLGYHLIAGNFDSDPMQRIMVQWIIGFVLGLVVPAFVWFYVTPALRGTSDPIDAVVADGDPARNPSALPAWAMLWFTPFLIARVLLSEAVEPGILAPAIVTIVVTACGVLGGLFLVAGIRALRSPSLASSLRIARVASLIALVIACVFVLVWSIAMFAMEPFERFRGQTPTGALVQLVACGAMMWWTLGRRLLSR